MNVNKMPTSLKVLKETIDKVELELEPEQDEERAQHLSNMLGWLQWTFNTLHNRRLYHKKRQLKWKMIQKVASEHLSEDELEAIDSQAEELVEKGS